MKSWRKTMSRLAVVLVLVLAVGGTQIAPHVVAKETEDAQGDQTEAIISANLQALEKLMPKGPSKQLCDVLGTLGGMYVNAGKYDEGLHFLKERIEIEQKLKDHVGEIDAKMTLALALVSAGRFSDAEPEFRAVMELAEAHGGQRVAIDAMRQIGTTLLKGTGQLEAAEKLYLQGYERIEQVVKERRARVGNNTNSSEDRQRLDNALDAQAALLVMLAQVDRQRNKFEEGLLKLKHAADLYKESGSGDQQVIALLDVGVLQKDLGRVDESNETYKYALKVDEEQSVFKAPQIDCALADNCLEQRKVSEAQKYYLDAARIASESREEIDRKVGLQALLGLGCCAADLGNIDEAEEYHRKVLTAAKAMTDRNGRDIELQALLQLGNDALWKGKAEQARKLLMEAQDLLSETGADAKTRGNVLVALGRCYVALGQVDTAIKHYQHALQLYTQAGEPKSQASALNLIMVAYLDNNRLTDFKRVSEEADALGQKVKDPSMEATFLFNKAQAELIQATTPAVNVQACAAAVPKYEQALASAKAVQDVGAEAACYRGLGVSELLSNQPDKALGHYQQGLVMAEKSGSIEAQWDSHLGLGKALRALGRNEEALAHLQQAVQLVEKERQNLSQDTFKTHNLDLRADCYLEMVGLLVAMNRPYDALEIAEKGRARAFLDMLANRKTRHVEVARVDDMPVAPVAKTAAAPPVVAMAVGSMERGTRGVHVAPRETAVIEETAISPMHAEAPGTKEIQDIIRKRASTIVEYFILPEELVVWVIDPDTTIHQQTIKITSRQLRDKVQAAMSAITAQPKDQAELDKMAAVRQAALKELYKIVIEPIAQYLPPSPDAVVTIIPHGPLFTLPFSALLAPDGSYLVEKHTICYTPAIGVLRATQKLAADMASSQHKLLALGNPITQQIAFLGALPYAEKEVKEIAQIYGQDKSVVKIGGDATKPVFESLCPKFSDIHLATHGLIDENQPMQSGLVLAPTPADDGMLYVKDIIGLKDFKARLVVLSACQTGRGQLRWGDGVIGLSRAFIIAGTPSVVVSQWNVDDVMTKYQMTHFYKQYLTGEDKAKCLRSAQIETIKLMESGSAPKLARANPKYWAAFELLGETR